ncbi:unnamed protein product [Rotaria socialis]|nr:unnamed protein product [Rotaria socialis]
MNDIVLIESSNGKLLGHDLHDQRLVQSEQQQYTDISTQLSSMEKFDGNGDAEDWLKKIMEKFEALKFTLREQNDLIPELLSGKALIWYSYERKKMPTFFSFITTFLQYYGRTEFDQDQITSISIKPETSVVQQELVDPRDSIIDALRDQIVIMNLQELPKFSGESKQSVTKWLFEFQQATNAFKLTDNEKLTYISLCLESYAQDWFYDNKHLFSTWSLLIEKFIKMFKLYGNDDSSFGQSHLAEYNMKQNPKPHCFEFMKLLNEKYDLAIQNSQLIERSRSSIHPIVCQENVITSTNVVIEDANTIIESVKADLNQADTLSDEMKRETLAIQVQDVHLVTSHDPCVHVPTLTKLTTISITVVSYEMDIFGKRIYNEINAVDVELKGSKSFSCKLNRPISNEILRETITQELLEKTIQQITTAVTINVYNIIFNNYWFIKRAFDPGGVLILRTRLVSMNIFCLVVFLFFGVFFL